MSDIFNPDLPKTRDDIKRDLVAQIYRNNMIARDAIIHALKFGFTAIWSHPEFSPQEVLGAIGTNGAKLFQTSGILQDALAAIVPSYERTVIPEWMYTINADGTVTYNAQPPQP